MKFVKNDFMGLKLDHDLIDSNSGKVIAKLGEKFNVVIAKKIEESGLKNLYVGNDFLIGKYLAKDIFDEKTGIIYFEAGEEITENTINYFEKNKI